MLAIDSIWQRERNVRLLIKKKETTGKNMTKNSLELLNRFIAVGITGNLPVLGKTEGLR